jgi:histidinol dehydrogenase
MGAQHLKTAGLTPNTTINQKVSDIVKGVIDDIKADGDEAVRKYSETFDKWSGYDGNGVFKLSDSQIEEIISKVSPQTVLDIKEAQKNVRIFAEAQRASIKDIEIEIQPGVFLGHRNNPIDRAGA